MTSVHDLGLIMLMAAVSYATRIAGFVATGWISESSNLVKWTDRLGTLVLLIILARILLAAPPIVLVGVGAAVVSMLLSSRFLPSMWFGVAVVAIGRLIG